jgi:type VI secretion system secreted protein VgrG
VPGLSGGIAGPPGGAASASTAGPAPRAGRWDEHDEDPSPGGPHRPAASPWTRAKITVEQLERRARRLYGETLCRRLAAGHVIVIADHDSTTYDMPYVLEAVRHVGIDPRQAGGREPYQAVFEGAPATVPLRPKPASRRLVQVAETARVIGPPGAREGEIHTDKLGRVKVELPWDAGDRPTGRASCWIRVAQAWAGAGFGAQFVPRVGMEVLVVFLGGDPDRPVITGALPNTEHLPPFDLPAAATTSGIRTQSVGGKGYNELVFVDTPGGELVRLRGESAVEIEASGPLALRSVGERLDASIGSRTTTVTGDDKLGIDGDRSVEVMGAESSFVFGDVTRATLGRASLRAVGPISHETEGGFFAKADGPVLLDAGTDVTLSSGPGNGVIQLAAGGALYAQSGREIHLTAAERIVLSVGTTKLEITADGAKVTGTDLVLEASGTLSASGPGPSLKLGEEAEMSSKAITLTSEDAQVTLTKTAEIKCADIKLGGKKEKKDEESESEETKKKPLELKLTDYDLEPYADKHYEVFAGGEKLEGTTTIDGELKVEVPEATTTALVKLWIDLYPEGRTRQYTIELGSLAPAKSPRGAKERLKNLGYYSGPIDDELGPGGVAAVEWFQRDHELEPTGELDDKTVSKLEEVHGE